jgi:hypothetical protein
MSQKKEILFENQLQQVQAWQIKQNNMIQQFRENATKSLPTYSEYLTSQNFGVASSSENIPMTVKPPQGYYRRIAMSDEALFPVARTQHFRTSM